MRVRLHESDPVNCSVASDGMMEKKPVASCLQPVQILTHGKGSLTTDHQNHRSTASAPPGGPPLRDQSGRSAHNFADLDVRSHGAADLRERLSQRTLATLSRASRMERRISLLHMHQASSAEKQARLCSGPPATEAPSSTPAWRSRSASYWVFLFIRSARVSLGSYPAKHGYQSCPAKQRSNLVKHCLTGQAQ